MGNNVKKQNQVLELKGISEMKMVSDGLNSILETLKKGQ